MRTCNEARIRVLEYHSDALKSYPGDSVTRNPRLPTPSIFKRDKFLFRPTESHTLSYRQSSPEARLVHQISHGERKMRSRTEARPVDPRITMLYRLSLSDSTVTDM